MRPPPAVFYPGGNFALTNFVDAYGEILSADGQLYYTGLRGERSSDQDSRLVASPNGPNGPYASFDGLTLGKLLTAGPGGQATIAQTLNVMTDGYLVPSRIGSDKDVAAQNEQKLTAFNAISLAAERCLVGAGIRTEDLVDGALQTLDMSTATIAYPTDVPALTAPTNIRLPSRDPPTRSKLHA